MPRLAYIIAATPRSGSFLLSEAISRTRVAGHPQEYGLEEDVATWREHYRCRAHVEYFHRYVSYGSTANGVFAAKLMWRQFTGLCEDICRYLGARADSRDEALRCLIGDVRYVRLVRKDRLRQAISLVRAMQSGVWTRRAGEPTPTARLRYDAAAISSALELITAQDAAWMAHMQRTHAAPLTVSYEEIERDDRLVVMRILTWLGLGEPDGCDRPQLMRQRDHLTEEWVQRYRSESAPERDTHPDFNQTRTSSTPDGIG